jgi:hypothetical protein
MKVSGCFKCCKKDNMYKIEEDDDYLEKTNENDYAEYPKLYSM